MFNVNLGSNIDLDISLAHSWSSEIYPSSAGKIGAAPSLKGKPERKLNMTQAAWRLSIQCHPISSRAL